MTTAIFNTKIGAVEIKIPETSGLGTTAVYNTTTGAVENEIPDVNDLVRKQFMTLKYQTLRKNTLLLLIIINLQVAYLN